MNNSNANKENENQGNCEIKDNDDEFDDESGDDVLANDEEFERKYTNLQKKWLHGQFENNNFDENENKTFGAHSYILQYLLNEGNEEDTDKMVFHPNYSYSYTNYEKDCILPLMNEAQLMETQKNYESHIQRLEKKIFGGLQLREKELAKEQEEKDKEEEGAEGADKAVNVGEWIVPPFCIPIRADIRQFEFEKLALKQKTVSGRLFDVIMMDPPWQLATANPTRGVAIGYSQLEDDIISGIPVQKLQDNGLLFVWVINAKYRLALQLFQKWGYTMIADIGWVKQTVNRRIANGHGFYLQHAKETCLIGLKGDLKKIKTLNNKKLKGICSDIIYSERRGQSQKPEEVYQYIEQLVPNGYYMEIFGRRNNLRNGWLTIGNEL